MRNSKRILALALCILLIIIISPRMAEAVRDFCVWDFEEGTASVRQYLNTVIQVRTHPYRADNTFPFPQSGARGCRVR